MVVLSSLTRRYRLAALHCLRGPALTPAENEALFGACSRLHGHDYSIEVTVAGAIDAASGLLANRDTLDQIVEDVLIRPYQGTNLSEYFPHTTGEALTVEFFRLLQPHLLPPGRLLRLRVHETAKNVFEFGAVGPGFRPRR